MKQALTFLAILSLLAACASPVDPPKTNDTVGVTSVSLDLTSGNLAVGGTRQLTATVLPANATNKLVNWSTQNAGVATVSNAGLITAQGVGTTNIVATTADGALHDEYAVTVVVAVTSVTINKTATIILSGATEQLFAVVAPSNAGDTSVTWSSDNESIATVSQTGVVTAVSNGDTVIRATSVQQDDKSDSAAVKVVGSTVALTAVGLSDTTGTISLGSTKWLTPTFTPATATNQVVTWTTSNAGVATVSNGLVTPVSVGTVVITVHAAGGLTEEANLTIVNVPATGVSVSPATATVNAGATVQLTATVSPTDASNKDVEWTSSSAHATVDDNGVVTGVSRGTATITATSVDGSFTDTMEVTVNQQVTGITLNQSAVTVPLGETTTLTATIEPADANNQGYTWSSSDSTVATVSGGVVTTKKKGSATITATSTDGSHTDTAAITVGQGLLINEVVSTGGYYGNNAMAFEIYNPSASAINLSGYSLRSPSMLLNKTASTLTYSSSTTFTLPSLSIPAGGYAAIRSKISYNNESGGMTVYLNDAVSDASTSYQYPWATNEFGFVELLRSSTTIDYYDWGGSAQAPTSGTFSGTGPTLANETEDQAATGTYTGYSWSRDASSTNTSSGSDWSLHAWSTLGGPNDITSDTDADLDGIPDEAEASGKTFAGLDLYSWGARTGQKDIFIHVSYQVNGSVGATDAGIIPQKAAFDKVVAAFEAQGIKVHLDVGNLFGSGVANYNLDGTSHAVAYNNGAIYLGKILSTDTTYYATYSNVYKYKVDSMAVAKSKVFFYMQFADTQSLTSGGALQGGSSGIANLPGNTSIITLGHWGLVSNGTTAQTNTLVNYQAATMMHEFGHNLGLHHGGNVDDNYKPNYFSVMNYLYQLDGLPTSAATHSNRYYAQIGDMFGIGGTGLNATWTTDATRSNWTDWHTSSDFLFTYSDGSGAQINESAASESVGIGRTSSQGIDYSNNGTISGTFSVDIRYNLNPALTTAPVKTTLNDYNDWGAINSIFQRSYSGILNGVGPRSVSFSELRDLLNESDLTTSDPCFNPFAVKAHR